MTTGARLRLYFFPEKLGTRALYCDTDSAMYVASTAETPPIECGDRLGDMKNELGPGEYIDEFVSSGPKTYAYKVVKPDGRTKTMCKVWGITLNYTTSQIVNFEAIRDMVLNGMQRDVAVHTAKKIRTKRERDGPFVVLQPEDKRYNITLFKRRRIDDNVWVRDTRKDKHIKRLPGHCYPMIFKFSHLQAKLVEMYTSTTKDFISTGYTQKSLKMGVSASSKI